MKLKIIYFVCCILISNTLHAQILLLKMDSTRVYYDMKLKDRLYNPFSEWSSNTIFNDSVSFHVFFDSVSAMKERPIIDFKKYQVGLDSYCAQCEAHCNHDKYDHNVCHRNSCSYTTVYYTQERSRREDINFKTIFLPDKFYVRDSIISSKARWEEMQKDQKISEEIDFDKEILLFRSAGGDCHAHFSHEFFLDHLNKRMVWKIFNHYGGCRAGLVKYFLIKVPKPTEGYSISFVKILVD